MVHYYRHCILARSCRGTRVIAPAKPVPPSSAPATAQNFTQLLFAAELLYAGV